MKVIFHLIIVNFYNDNNFTSFFKFNDLEPFGQNHRYLDLLAVLCVCDGVSIPDNQIYITQVWLMKGNRVTG